MNSVVNSTSSSSKKTQMEASLSIISLLTYLQPATIITNPSRHQFLHYLKSSATPSYWVFGSQSPLQHLSALRIAFYCLNITYGRL